MRTLAALLLALVAALALVASAAALGADDGLGDMVTHVVQAPGSDPDDTTQTNGNEQVFDNANDDGTGTTVVLSNGNAVHTLNSKYAVKEEQSKQRIKQEQAVKKGELSAAAKREEMRVKRDTAKLDAQGRANEVRLKAATNKFRGKLEAREKRAAAANESRIKRVRAAHQARLRRHKALAETRAKHHVLRTKMLRQAHAAMRAAGAEGRVELSRAWRPYGGGWQVPRAYRVAGRVAVLQGLLRGTAVKGMVAVLPAPVRPRGGRLIFQQLHGNRAARVDVLPDGRVYLVASNRGSSWLSLDGIMYDVAGGQVSPSLLSNWAAYGRGYRAPRQTRVGGVCMLSGLVRAGEWRKLVLQLSGGGAQRACLPPRRLIFNGPHHLGVQRLDLLPNPAGGLQHVPASAVRHDWVSLDQMSWPAGFGRPLRLNGRWTNYNRGYQRASYAKVSDSLCVLSGLVRYKHGRWHPRHRVVAHLPVGCRPRRRLVAAANAHERMVRLDVLPSGAIVWITGSRHGWVSLSGIRFIAYN